MPKALPSPQEYANKLKDQFQDKAILVVEELRELSLTQLHDVIEWDINIYFDEVKLSLNEKRD
jgi:hypothetical protein